MSWMAYYVDVSMRQREEEVRRRRAHPQRPRRRPGRLRQWFRRTEAPVRTTSSVARSDRASRVGCRRAAAMSGVSA